MRIEEKLSFAEILKKAIAGILLVIAVMAAYWLIGEIHNEAVTNSRYQIKQNHKNQ